MKFRVWICFMNNFSDSSQNDGKWHRHFLDNNDKGFSADEALEVAEEFGSRDNIKNIEIEEMGSEIFYTLNQFRNLRRGKCLS